ncbi:40362_t:CDS:2, partial [Gigaspora margarita]
MSVTQPMDTNNACNTDDQITHRADSMDLDDLTSHTAKKVKATLSEEISATIPIESLPMQTASTQNDEKLKPPKILQGTFIPKKKPQKSLQQPDLAQVNEHTNEQNKDVVMDGSDTLEQERQALLMDESISFDFEDTEPGSPNSEDDMTPTTGNTKQYMIDTDAASNATIEGTK